MSPDAKLGALVVGAALAAVFAGVPLAKRAWERFSRRRGNYGGLYGFVSFTARLVAAGRAYESEQEDALFKDPLAAHFAGPEATARVKKLSERGVEEDKNETNMIDFMGRRAEAPDAKRKVGRLTIRVKWYDDAMLHALRHSSGPSGPPPPRQVVLLGSGMDSRAWRLDLPAGVRWFEVDQEDVQRAKRGLLMRAGAALHAGHPKAKVPLKAAAWHSMVTNLLHPGWAAELEKGGFDPRQPTLWVAEGLLNYLEPLGVHTTLSEAARASAPGSVLLTDVLNRGYLDAAAAVQVPGELRPDEEETNMQTMIARYMKWGCPDSEPEAKAFFKEVGWEVERMDNSAVIAPKVAGPGLDFAFKPVAPTKVEEFNYRLVVAHLA